MKINPTGNSVVFGTHGGLSKVEVCSLKPDGSLVYLKTFDLGLSSALLHIDWTTDGKSVVLNSQAYELMFFDIVGGTKINASSAKDWTYYTWTCKLGFPVQGIFPGVDLTDVNDVCRSHNQKVLASGEDSSLVKLFKYPCTQEKA